MCLAVLRIDGFLSLTAGREEGCLTTKPLRIEGKRLFMNIDASGGKAAVEVLNSSGKVIPGYSVDDCVAVTDDRVHAPIVWKAHEDCASLSGKTVGY